MYEASRYLVAPEEWQSLKEVCSRKLLINVRICLVLLKGAKGQESPFNHLRTVFDRGKERY